MVGPENKTAARVSADRQPAVPHRPGRLGFHRPAGAAALCRAHPPAQAAERARAAHRQSGADRPADRDMQPTESGRNAEKTAARHNTDKAAADSARRGEESEHQRRTHSRQHAGRRRIREGKRHVLHHAGHDGGHPLARGQHRLRGSAASDEPHREPRLSAQAAYQPRVAPELLQRHPVPLRHGLRARVYLSSGAASICCCRCMQAACSSRSS